MAATDLSLVALVILQTHPLKENISSSQRNYAVQHQFSRTRRTLYRILHTNHQLKGPLVILFLSPPARTPSSSLPSPHSLPVPSLPTAATFLHGGRSLPISPSSPMRRSARLGSMAELEKADPSFSRFPPRSGSMAVELPAPAARPWPWGRRRPNPTASPYPAGRALWAAAAPPHGAPQVQGVGSATAAGRDEQGARGHRRIRTTTRPPFPCFLAQ
jgi:hypothetical protein